MQLPDNTIPPLDEAAMESELSAIYQLYTCFSSELDLETGLGGRLLFAGALKEDGVRLVRAANIAGAASLSASTDRAMQRGAIREGVVDFQVTSLDEALRILKNEIRKRQAVAVLVAATPELMAEEMLERGVLPDLLPPFEATSQDLAAACARFVAQGARHIQAPSAERGLCILPVPAGWAQRIAAFDDLVLESIPQTQYAARRWLRLAPRYLGPSARKLRTVGCDVATATWLQALAQSAAG